MNRVDHIPKGTTRTALEKSWPSERLPTSVLASGILVGYRLESQQGRKHIRQI